MLNNKHNSHVWNEINNNAINQMGDPNSKLLLQCGEINLQYWLKYDHKNNKYSFQNCKESTVFSLGKRNCPGRVLAEKQLYCMIANIIMRYDLRFADQNTPIKTKMSVTQFVSPSIGIIPIKR